MVSRKHYAWVAAALSLALAASLLSFSAVAENSTGTALEEWADAKCQEYGGEAYTIVESDGKSYVVCYPNGDLVEVDAAEIEAARKAE